MGEKPVSDEREGFHQRVRQKHGRVHPCFMTGKGCVYTEAIDREIERRSLEGGYAGFRVTPFQPNLNVFHQNCLDRYLDACYSPANGWLKVIRADQVRRTGYVICEKICKKIQESDFILVDISVPNPNVFYELGLAYGLGQKVLVVHHKGASFGGAVATYLSPDNCRAYAYNDLEPIAQTNFTLSHFVWQNPAPSVAGRDSPSILVLDLGEPRHDAADGIPRTAKGSASDVPTDICLEFHTHVESAVGVSISEIMAELERNKSSLIETYGEQIRKMKDPKAVKRDESFREILNAIANAFCLIIRTGSECHPMAYFWLGYCHAIGKHVIPVTILRKRSDEIDDLAFDIRALWHMTFIEERATDFVGELRENLQQMILSDFEEWSRRSFWDSIFGKRGEVSIFTGALHNPQFEREMIGDWDLRTASELTSYFATHHYRATIESPVYQIENIRDWEKNRGTLIGELSALLKNKNCILVASPDVNSLTEIALGRIYSVPEADWFAASDNSEAFFYCVIAIKERSGSSSDQSCVRRAFYKELPLAPGRERSLRGFQTKCMKFKDDRIMAGFVSQAAPISSEFDVYAHLLVARNPFCDGGQDPRYIVILNGISGPATFALTHILTGGVSREFADYQQGFRPESAAEKELFLILQDLAAMELGDGGFVQYVYKITVGPPAGTAAAPAAGLRMFDPRRVKRWERIASFRHV